MWESNSFMLFCQNSLGDSFLFLLQFLTVADSLQYELLNLQKFCLIDKQQQPQDQLLRGFEIHNVIM